MFSQLKLKFFTFQALLNINTAALISTGLLATSSAFISYIFRRYIVLGKEEKAAEKNRRSDNGLENELLSALNNFKLVYKNSSGARVGKALKYCYIRVF